MFFEYTVEIIEKRQNNKKVLCACKNFLSKKNAISFAITAIDKIKEYPNDVIIYKTSFFGHGYSKIFFDMRNSNIASFNESDLYLN